MKQLTCEMCGGTDLVKQDGVFVCQQCGCKYSLEEAKKLMVEGVVQVEGTVSIENEGAIKHNLELARNSEQAANWEEAEKRADRVLELDTGNLEAWMIKAKAVDAQSTIKVDRMLEVATCYKHVIDGIHDHLPDVSIDEVKMLETARDAMVDLIAGRYKWYGGFYAKFKGDVNMGKKILNDLGESVKTSVLMVRLIQAYFRSKEDDFRTCFERGGADASEGSELWHKLISADEVDDAVGDIYLRCATQLNNAVCDAETAITKEHTDDSNIFTYYTSDSEGDRKRKEEKENNFLSAYYHRMNDLVALQKEVIGLLMHRETVVGILRKNDGVREAREAVMRSADDLRGILGDLSDEQREGKLGAALVNLARLTEERAKDEPKLQTPQGILDTYYSNMVFYEERKRDRSTRYIVRYHNGNVDGPQVHFGASDKAKKLINGEIAELKHEQRENLKQIRTWTDAYAKVREAAKQKRVDAYWAEHAVEKAQLEARRSELQTRVSDLESQRSKLRPRIEAVKTKTRQATPSDALRSESSAKIRQLESELASLTGLFKGSEKKRLQGLIDSERARLREFMKASTAERSELRQSIDAEIAPLKSNLERLTQEVEKAASELRKVNDELTRDRPEAASPKNEGCRDVWLESCGDNKIDVIKALRELAPLGLKEAKELVEKAPAIVLSGFEMAEAKKAKIQLEAAGGVVALI